MNSSLLKKFAGLFTFVLGLFGPSLEQKREQEERRLKIFDEERKLEILIAMVSLKQKGIEIPTLLDLHQELKNTNRYMHATNILKYLAMLIEVGSVRRIGHQKFAISDNGLNSINLQGR